MTPFVLCVFLAGVGFGYLVGWWDGRRFLRREFHRERPASRMGAGIFVSTDARVTAKDNYIGSNRPDTEGER